VHSSFCSHYLRNYFKAREILTRVLENPKYKNYILHNTGCSLGAAVATILMPDKVKFMKAKGNSRLVQAFVYGFSRLLTYSF
ncbi:hypothetical protein K502DRAFT_292456, partial [Neoconidiobolus thromboides FSU 785]